MKDLIIKTNNEIVVSDTTSLSYDDLCNVTTLAQMRYNINRVKDLLEQRERFVKTNIKNLLLNEFPLSNKYAKELLKLILKRFYPLNENQECILFKKANYKSRFYNYKLFVKYGKKFPTGQGTPQYIDVFSDFISLYEFGIKSITYLYGNADKYGSHFKSTGRYTIQYVSLERNPKIYRQNHIIDFHNNQEIINPISSDFENLIKLNYPYYLQAEAYAGTISIGTDANNILNREQRYSAQLRTSLMSNEFTSWDWDLVEDIAKGLNIQDIGLKLLLENKGFIAQMGIDNINETFDHLQEISNNTLHPIDVTRIELAKKKYQDEKLKRSLYAYLPLDYTFIAEHMDELDWNVIAKNPRVIWSQPLFRLYLRMIEIGKCEIQCSAPMYDAIEQLLDDEMVDELIRTYELDK